MKKILLLAFAAVLLASCDRGNHFLTDKDYRMQVHADFIARRQLADGRADALFAGMDTLRQPEREALEFLYAYMPYSDLADYDQTFYLKQVRTAFAAREQMPWGKKIPEDVFRHFVLVYRVNNENLDTARVLMFNELKSLVRGMSMEQAALEVNHWCHEHVAYRASDSRTSAPLATMRTGLGRCGEESTFAVTALRSVGIPARQCYTPRWAHCDDNHAWVEVWIDGEWKFMGACEPDPRLDMGWFSVPSTRCMMVHTKAFGRYQGDEEAVVTTPLYSELNLLSHYAPTRSVSVTVCSPDGRPVEGVQVKFKIYNYAEYYTLATKTTDDWGQAFLTTGLGDMLVWATDGHQYSFRKIDVRSDSTVTLILGVPDTVPVHALEMDPPVAGMPKVTATADEVEMNSVRLAFEDSLRAAYRATFPTVDDYRRRLPKDWCWSQDLFSDSEVWEIVSKAEGNYEEIFTFFETWSGQNRGAEHLYDYLKTFSDKDLRDITAEVLTAHRTTFDWNDRVQGTAFNYPFTYEVYWRGILPARISNEMVRPYRDELASFKDMSARQIMQWVKDSIVVDNAGNYYNCPISPVGVYRLRYADAHSRDIFFVAACRAAGVPAYLDNATNIIYVWDGGAWDVRDFDVQGGSNNANAARLTLTYSGEDPAMPVYWPHFTLARLEGGDLHTFDFEDDPRMEWVTEGGVRKTDALDLEPGIYCLSTGNRYPDGAVQSRLDFFELKAGDNASREVVIPALVPREEKIRSIDRNIELFDGVELWDYAGNSGMLYINLGNYGEPSKHLVVELNDHQEQMKRWGGMTFMVGPANIGMEEWQLANTDMSYRKGVLEQRIVDAIHGNGQYPLVALIDKGGNILYYSEGYKIGIVDQVLKAVGN